MSEKTTFMILKENERETRKKLIIDAAINLFAKKSFNDVSIRDIASEAGISPASIYRYFSDRDELFLEAFVYKARDICRKMEKHINKNRNISIESIATDYIDYLLNHDSFFQMMTHFMINSNLDEQSLEKFNATERYLLSVFDNVFSDIGNNGNVRFLSHAFFASLNGILITFRNYPGRSGHDVRRHMHRLARLVAGLFKKEA